MINKWLTLAGLLPALLLAIQAGSAATAPRTLVITIDDLPTASVLGEDFDRARQTTDRLVAALVGQKIPAIGFVNEQKLAPAGVVAPERVALLQTWIDAGLDLGNHTYSHADLHRVGGPRFIDDIRQGEAVTRPLLRRAGKDLIFFRHPFLHTGTSAAARQEIDAYLARANYRVAPVTIDNYDYIFAAAYDRAFERQDFDQSARIIDAYVDYMEAVVAFYEQQSSLIVGREIPQTLLIHANALNAATLDRLAERLRRRGYRFIRLAEALGDPAYTSRDDYFGPGGISWLHRWALTAGRKGIFGGEPAVPDWITRASQPTAR